MGEVKILSETNRNKKKELKAADNIIKKEKEKIIKLIKN